MTRLAKPMPLQEGVIGSAEFSDCMKYRFVLSRIWNDKPGKRMVAFIGLNPSCASADEDDRTVRKCQLIARNWGADGMYMLNVYPFRATDPKEMEAYYASLDRETSNALFRRNVDTMKRLQSENVIFVGCWGANAMKVDDTCNRLAWLFCHFHLGLTKHGHPRHPLYLPNTTLPIRWE